MEEAGPEDEGFALERCVQYAAARLLQTAFEHQVNAQAMVPNVVLLVQVAANLMTQDRSAIRELLGIEGG